MSKQHKDIELLQNRLHQNPHAFLGMHALFEQKVIRVFRPGQSKVEIELKGEKISLQEVGKTGLFELKVPIDVKPLDYQILYPSGLKSFDPYVFSETFREKNLSAFKEGNLWNAFEMFGGRLADGGVKFALWAPNAMQVSLVGDFNEWDGNCTPMRLLGSSGVWEIFLPGLAEEEKYKFEIKTSEGHILVKADPFALQAEFRPGTASIICNVDSFKWDDQEWMNKREGRNYDKEPLNIYELHVGSWMQEDGDFINYRTLAFKLVDYCKKMHFTHVEFLPLSEHPYDESWGYQVSGYYAITSRFGTVKDFQYLVDYLHSYDIGVLFDFVPAHFPMDAFALAQFDGTYLYEHEDPKRGFHPSWNTLIFDYGRKEVANFLISSALYYIEKMHIDGIRMDAVASLLYLDFERNEEQWESNHKGGRENLEAIAFIKNLNAAVHEKFPGVIMIAEDSSSFPNVTKPVSDGGLGFDYKWGIGWMSDTLRVFESDFRYRSYEMKHIAHEMEYFYTEKFILSLSHDEVVHGLKSLIEKMPGDEFQKFAGMRLLLSYQMCHPGKKLLFMGGEIGQWTEWYCKEQVHWHLLDRPLHAGLKKCAEDMNELYLKKGAFWEKDFDKAGFEWIDKETPCYLRRGESSQVICIHNFSAQPQKKYVVGTVRPSWMREIFNSDSKEYGGFGLINETIEINEEVASVTLAPLSTIVLEGDFG
ncbi:MAG: 1,4-alpha-glucan branching protein GlgB [Simkaniaceae bacterium]|nr:1,4-alpha-glucan branching protein GlgB [Simkaniaceae bacterium]